MEDDWSSGYSGYSLDTPLFSSLAQEAASDWKLVKSKKTTKHPKATGKGAGGCPCHIHYIHNGRYDVLSDCNYNPVFSDFDPSYFDLDIRMLVADR